MATLPLEEPSDDLEERILAAERTAMRRAPWYTKVVRGAAWAGSLAMRPQLAMAALFVLVVGSSLLLLRARPGTVGAPVAVTQRGEPGPTSDVAEEPKRAEARGADNAPKVGGLREGYRADEERAEGKKNADPATIAATPPAATAADGAAATASPEAASAGDGQDAPKMLADARAAKQKGGCASAISRLNAVTDKFPSSPEAAQAKQEVADCERQAGPAVAEPPPAPPAAMAPKPMKSPAPSPMPASSDAYRR
jgi:hypothetical protein